MPEAIPTGIKIQRARMIPGFTQAAFEPLIGSTKWSEFNAGQSDRWAGLYTFVPTRSAASRRLMAWLMRIKNIETFYAYDPTHQVPAGGVVNGMTYTSHSGDVVTIGNGPISQTPLVEGDYMQIAAQYFQLLADLTTNGSGNGSVRVWPAPRPGFAAPSEPVVTDHPVMEARVTSPVPRPIEPGQISQITISWEEAI